MSNMSLKEEKIFFSYWESRNLINLYSNLNTHMLSTATESFVWWATHSQKEKILHELLLVFNRSKYFVLLGLKYYGKQRNILQAKKPKQVFTS